MSVFASARHLLRGQVAAPATTGPPASGAPAALARSKWLGSALEEAALAAIRSKNTYLAAQSQRLTPRLGHGRALGAVKRSRPGRRVLPTPRRRPRD
ncbi:MAG TPA: hypothetical protein VF526_21520 [Solirubrobacteraceae bacterium]